MMFAALWMENELHPSFLYSWTTPSLHPWSHYPSPTFALRDYGRGLSRKQFDKNCNASKRVGALGRSHTQNIQRIHRVKPVAQKENYWLALTHFHSLQYPDTLISIRPTLAFPTNISRYL
jgi:hypothetical protein